MAKSNEKINNQLVFVEFTEVKDLEPYILVTDLFRNKIGSIVATFDGNQVSGFESYDNNGVLIVKGEKPSDVKSFFRKNAKTLLEDAYKRRKELAKAYKNSQYDKSEVPLDSKGR